jgi:signal transduction histidine kinase
MRPVPGRTAVLGLLLLAGLVLLARALGQRARAEQQMKEREERTRQVLEELEQAKRDADRANRAKSEFLSKMSHELRTPLNAILGFGQLLQLEELGQEQAEGVDHILRGGRHLLGLINEVLDISRIETGSLSLSPEPVDVLEVVKDTVDLIGPLAAEREITVQAPSAGDGGWTVQADHQRLKQVLLNLASNAVKYGRHGGHIGVACRSVAQGRVAIVVSDDGDGIPADKMARLFKPFDRLGAEQSEVQGTGMGLALSKGLVEAMGGSLTAESVVGEGTTFTIELAEVAEAAEPHDDGPARPPEPAGDPGEQQTVLYVEDNPSNLRLVERVLAAGAREYLTKPLDVVRFRAVVDGLLASVASRP